MVVDLLSGKKRFATLMDDIQPMVISQFIVWLDEKVAEFKCQGCMNLEINFEAPKWIKDYSMSMLISGAGLSDIPSSSRDKESSPYSHSRPSPVSPQPPRRTQGAVTPLAAARRLQSQGGHSPGVSERMGDVPMSSKRKRVARETESPDLELIEVKKERLEEDLYVVEESSSNAMRVGKGNSRSASLPYESVSDILNAVSAGNRPVSVSNVIPSSASNLTTQPVVSYHYSSSQSRKTIPPSANSSLQDADVSSDKRLLPYSVSSGIDEETNPHAGLEMSVDADEQSGYSFVGDDTQHVSYPDFDGDRDSDNDSSAFTDIKPALSHSPSGDSADAADPLSQMQIMKAGPSSGYSETDERSDTWLSMVEKNRHHPRMPAVTSPADQYGQIPSILQQSDFLAGNILSNTLMPPRYMVSASDYEWKCPECATVFSSKATFREHMTCMHTNQTYSCELCSKQFKWRHSLYRHRKKDHC